VLGEMRRRVDAFEPNGVGGSLKTELSLPVAVIDFMRREVLPDVYGWLVVW